jgi:hypothetical protein
MILSKTIWALRTKVLIYCDKKLKKKKKEKLSILRMRMAIQNL